MEETEFKIKTIVGQKLLNFIRETDIVWNWIYISENPNITMNHIRENPNLPWAWHFINYNPNLTMDFIREHPDKPWNWYWISINLSSNYFKEIKGKIIKELEN